MIGWLDIAIVVILLVTLIVGLVKGFIREAVGVAATIGGFFLAAHQYPRAALLVGRIVRNETAAKFLGFMLIFAIVVLAGSLAALLLSKVMKGPLRLINHLFGGLFGLLEGVLISGAVVFALLVFPLDAKAVPGSKLAPFCYGLTRIMVDWIPEELKDAARDAYETVVGRGKDHGQEI